MQLAVKATLASLLVLISVAGTAASEASSQAKSEARDPEQKVCEDITLVGSRLAVKRVCATRAQWEEKRRRDRELTDQAQRSPCVVSAIDAGKQIC